MTTTTVRLSHFQKYCFTESGAHQSLDWGFLWQRNKLTHLPLMHPLSTLWKRQKKLRFSDVFRGVEKACIGNE